jgi:hypothetical protein
MLTRSASDSACILCITCLRWIFTVISPRERINAPLRHLLLMTFFGDSADSFFEKGVTRGQPSAGRSYPCLNVVCPADLQGHNFRASSGAAGFVYAGLVIARGFPWTNATY